MVLVLLFIGNLFEYNSVKSEWINDFSILMKWNL